MKIPRKHILVVESDDNSVEMLRLYLGHVMYRVTAAGACGECLQLARTERVDLYLLGDGCEAGGAFELCRKIRALDSNTPIIFCSADASCALICWLTTSYSFCKPFDVQPCEATCCCTRKMSVKFHVTPIPIR